MRKIYKLTMLLITLTISTSLMAANQTVTNNNDNGAGSLRQAIADVGDGETITFDADYTITLASELTINKNLTITGTGEGLTIIQANANPNTATYRVFSIPSGTVTISDMTIRNGNFSQSGSGIYHLSGTLTLTDCTISGNSSTNYGGGIYSAGTINLTNCTVSGNTTSGSTYGGGIENNGGTLTMTDCTISGNTTTSNGAGGGIHNDDGTITMTNSTLSGNSCGWGGGGIYNDGSSASTTMTNCTVSENIADDGDVSWGDGGGILNYAGTVTLNNCTVSENQIDATSDGYGGGYCNYSGTLNIKNTIIVNNTNGSGNDDYYYSDGTLTDNGYNIVEYQSGASTGTNKTFTATTDILYNTKADGTTGYSTWNRNNSDLANQNLNLSSTLANNGGPTQTLAVTSGSFAISGGLWDASVTTDQRGESRHEFSPTIGSYEPRYAGYWTGASNSDWNTDSNWDDGSEAGASDDVIIPNVANDPVIAPTGTASCNNLTVKSGATLTIQSNGSGTGSLIVNGTATGSVTMERYIVGYTDNNDGWHFLSSPIATFTISGSSFEPGLTDDLYRWEESTSRWMNYKAGDPTEIEAGTGYLTAWDNTVTKSFTGTLNNSDIPKSNLSYNLTADYPGMHLLGNPFPCALQWNPSSGSGWEYSNVGGTAKIWNESGASYSDIGANGYIPATQGFMTYVSDGTNTLTIPTTNRVHNSTNWYKDEETNKIILTVHDPEGSTFQETIIWFNANASDNFDIEYDSYFMGGYAPLFYSAVEGEALSTNSLPELKEELTIPLYFTKNSSSAFYIEAEGLDNLIPSYPAYLTDLKTNYTQNLIDNPIYSFSSNQGDDTARFILHFKSVGIEENIANNNIQIWSANKSIHILNPNQQKGTIRIINIYGQELFKSQLNGDTKQLIHFNATAAYYIVNIITDTSSESFKIFINK
ncbi:choice-of-anchor Q domain-containing protein [Bacteroidota bacterium]